MRTRVLSLIGAMVGATCIALAGCGSSSTTTVTSSSGATDSVSSSASATTSGGGNVGDACALVTASDVSSAMNVQLSRSGAGASSSTCLFVSADGASFVAVGLHALPQADAARAAVQAALAAEGNVQQVSGIGDAAYTFVSKGSTGGAGIVVLKGSVYISIVCEGATASVAAATGLAQIALGRF